VQNDIDSKTANPYGQNGCCERTNESDVHASAFEEGYFPKIRLSFSLSGVLLILVWSYKQMISPWLPQSCRFTPTCSAYAAGAIMEHGAFKGTFFAVSRLLRCHPFCQGGFDPVPPKKSNISKEML